MNPSIVERGTTTGTSADQYEMTREIETAGHLVRVRIRRSTAQYDSFAVADMLTGDGTWRRMADVPPACWTAPEPCDTLDVTAALGGLADRLVDRVCELITAPPPIPPTLSEHVVAAIGALLANHCSYSGEFEATADGIEWARTHGGPFRIIEEPNGTVTFTKAHRAGCPYVVSSGAQVCDDECYFD